MNKFLTLIMTLVMTLSSGALKAQSLGDIFSSGKVSDVVASVTGGASLTQANIVGTWDYVGPAVELTDDNLLASAAGAVVSSQLETKLGNACTKAGIKPGTFAFVFNSDYTFTSNVMNRKVGGTYTIDSEAGTITLNYGIYNAITIGRMTAKVTLVGNSMSILFTADKLLKLISTISSYSSNESVKLVKTLVDQYDGINLGFELKTEAKAAKAEPAKTATETAAKALSKWF